MGGSLQNVTLDDVGTIGCFDKNEHTVIKIIY